MASPYLRKKYRKLATDPTDTIALSYRRVSSKEQAEEGVSLQVQQAHLEAYIATRRYEFGGLYEDTMTGAKADRPGYQRLLAEVRRLHDAGRQVAVVVPYIKRLGRNMAEGAKALEELEQLGVGVHSVDEGGELQKFLGHVLMAVAEVDNKERGRKVAQSKQMIANAGLPPTGRPAWGYRWRAVETAAEASASLTKTVMRQLLVPDAAQAPAVRECFARCAAGDSLAALSVWAAGLTNSQRGGRHLGRAALSRVLHSALYTGRYDNDAGREASPDHPEAILALPQGRWESLVSDDLWLTVQRVLHERRSPGRPAAKPYLLTGRVRCPACGGRMVGNSSIQRRAYRCDAASMGLEASLRRCSYQTTCHGVDAAVLAAVTALLAPLADTRLLPQLTAAWEALRAATVSPDDGRLHQLERELDKARNRLQAVRDAFADGDYNHDGGQERYTAALTERRATIARLAAERAALLQAPAPEGLPSLEVALARVGGFGYALETADVPAQRQVLSALTERVVPHRIAKGQYRIEIEWTALGKALRKLTATV